MLSLISGFIEELAMYRIKVEKKEKETKKETCSYLLRMVTVGPPKCGKTWLMNKITRDRIPNSHDIAVSVEEYNFEVPLKVPCDALVKEPTVAIQITELSGASRYGKFWIGMMRNMPVVVLVYDCQKEGSFEETLGFYESFLELEQWRHTTFVLMATKADNGVTPKIPFKKVRGYAHEKGWLFFKTSARDNSSAELLEKFSRLATAVTERWWTEDVENLWSQFMDPPEVIYRFIS
jgi:GTPase SAR1 family protein